MVACAALASQPLVSPVVSMTASCAGTALGIVEQLKHQLLIAVEKENESDLLNAVTEIEKFGFSRELLESTRFGAVVNDVRRQITEKFPAIAKRCRALIKQWQQLIQARPGSSCASSANGTPNLVGRRLTPATPVNKRVTSTGIADTRQTLSPSGGYAAKALSSSTSPVGVQSQSQLHKSATVAADLSRRAEETQRNGKRKAEEPITPGQTGVPQSGGGLKRTRTVAASLASPAATPQSVLAARRSAVQSTADLISQLSSNLPEHMSIDESLRQHEEKVRREQADVELAMSLSGATAVTPSPYLKGKRKYERKIPRAGAETSTPAGRKGTAIEDGPRGGLILRIPRTPHTPSVERDARETASPAVPVSNRYLHDIDEEASSSSVDARPRDQSSREKVDWLAMLPSLDSLRKKAQREERVVVDSDPKKSSIVKVHGREVLALPYLSDVDPKPDFLLYKYTNPLQYFAEENFMYGSKRPKESEL